MNRPANDGRGVDHHDGATAPPAAAAVEYHVLYYKATGNKVHKGRGVSKADGILTIRPDAGSVRLEGATASEADGEDDGEEAPGGPSSAPLYSGTNRDLARRCHDLENLENLRLGKYEVDVGSKRSPGGDQRPSTKSLAPRPSSASSGAAPTGQRPLPPSSRGLLVSKRARHQPVVPVRRPALAATATTAAVAPSSSSSSHLPPVASAATAGAPRSTVVTAASTYLGGRKPLLPRKRPFLVTTAARSSAEEDDDGSEDDASAALTAAKTALSGPFDPRPPLVKRRGLAAAGLSSKGKVAGRGGTTAMAQRPQASAATGGRAAAAKEPHGVASSARTAAAGATAGARDRIPSEGDGKDDEVGRGEVASITLLPVKVTSVLRPHQKEAVTFLLKALEEGGGAVLADEPGLGKTLTTIACIAALHRLRRRKHFCVVCPSSLVGNWAKEFDRWLGVQGQPKRVKLLKGDTTFNSSSMKGFLHSKVGQVVILSYDLFRLHSHHFENGSRFGLLVVDEGHRLKSTSGSLTLASLERLPAEARLLLSATPIQNNLGEFYALANFCRPGVLGQDLTEFRSRFERPILRHRSSSSGDRQVGECPAQRELDGIVSTFFLRRLQRDILKSALPPRTELLLFCRPSRRQVELYQRVVEGARGALGGSSTEILNALTSLRKVCSHPRLLHGTASTYPGLHGVEVECDFGDTAPRLPDGNADEVVDLSGKLTVLRGLLRSMTESNHGSDAASPNKVVIVSNFTSTLSLVESLVLEPAGHTYLRLDGATSMEDRQARVEAFNKQPRLFCFLLSSKAGGCGLNLIGANRLVLLDPSWNPADDIQAMGRIYRQGQTRPTTIYRMFTSGTIEEVMYQRQQTKNTLSEGVLDKSGQGGFSREEISDCLTLKLGCDCDAAQKAVPRSGKPWPAYTGPSSLPDLGCADKPLLDVAERLGSVLGFVRLVPDVEEEQEATWDGSEQVALLGCYESDEEEEFEFEAKPPSTALQSRHEDGADKNQDDDSSSASEFQFT